MVDSSVRIAKVTEGQLRRIRTGYDRMPILIFKNQPQGFSASVRLLDEEIEQLEFLLQKRQFRGKMKNPDMGRRQQGQKRMKVILETGRNGISVGSKESREKLNQAGQNGGDPAKRGRPARAKKSKEQKTIEETRFA